MISTLAAIALAALPADAPDAIFRTNTIVGFGEAYGSVEVYDSPPDHTVLDVRGGSISDLSLHDASSLNLHTGSVSYILGLNSSTVNLIDGTTLVLVARDSSTLNVYDGLVRLVFDVQATSTANVFGGQINCAVGVGDSGVINIYGGQITFEPLVAIGSGALNLYGGTLRGGLDARDQSTVRVYGYDFNYDSTSLLLDGFLADGSPFSLYLADEATFSHIQLLPEPASLTLVLAGFALLAGRFSRSRQETPPMAAVFP
jgi:hypothetical protein